jgi:hypothetical protein
MSENVVGEKAMTRTQRNILLFVIGVTLACMATYNLVKS